MTLNHNYGCFSGVGSGIAGNVMLGDNGKFWVACFADAQKLQKAGYEIAA